jgi:hypothetical protein
MWMIFLITLAIRYFSLAARKNPMVNIKAASATFGNNRMMSFSQSSSFPAMI